jgi:hypothetical protein
MRILSSTCAAIVLLSLMSCCSTSGTGGRHARPDRAEAISPVRPDPSALHHDEPSALVQRLPRVESSGDCAPHYKAGGEGSCINNKPCRGFGVRDETGRILCSCYGTIGGCSEGQRCDARKVTCVPEDEPYEDG